MFITTSCNCQKILRNASQFRGTKCNKRNHISRCSNKYAKTHYTEKNRGSDLLSHVRGKVNLYAFLEEHPILNDFELGWFLHIVTDYLFFCECFTNEYLVSKSYEEFCKELYHAYYCVNLYMEENYNVKKDDFKEYPYEYYPGIPYENCILPKEMVDNFIKRVSSIDLDKYITKIRQVKKNIKP